MKIRVLGAGGGVGCNVVDAAARAGHDVPFVRQVRGDPLPTTVQVIGGDARLQEDVTRTVQRVHVAYFCLNPRFARWLEFPPLLATAVATARQTGARLVFRGNVRIYGPGREFWSTPKPGRCSGAPNFHESRTMMTNMNRPELSAEVARIPA